MAFGAPSIKGRGLRYLAQREHSRVELERKLARHVEAVDGVSAEALIAAALDELTAKGLLSDERTAQSVLRTQGQRFGSRRLQQTLQHKGLAPPLVAETVAIAREGDLERARDLFARRFGAAADAAAADGDGGSDASGTAALGHADTDGDGAAASRPTPAQARAAARDAAQRQGAERARLRARQTRFLIARGFDGETVRRVLAGRADGDEEAG